MSGDAVSMAYGLVAAVPVVLAAVVDVRSRRIPNQLVGLALVAGICVGLIAGEAPRALLGGVVALLIAATPWLIAPAAFGPGDAKLLGAAGAIVGIEQVVTLFVTVSLLGGLMAVVVMLTQRSRAASMPYGPAIAGGLVATLLMHP